MSFFDFEGKEKKPTILTRLFAFLWRRHSIVWNASLFFCLKFASFSDSLYFTSLGSDFLRRGVLNNGEKMMILEIFPSGPFGTNTMLLGCPQSKKGIIIDPAFLSEKKISSGVKKHGLTIIAIFLTHSHWDHIGEVKKLKEKYSIPVYVHSADQDNLKNPGSDGLPLFSPVQGVDPDGELLDQQIWKIGQIEMKVIHTPGHTPGSVCFYIEKENILLSGDTLFKGSIGNLSFPGSNPQKMWQSLKKLSALPPNTRVYPGHGEATTIGEEAWLENAEDCFG